MKLTIDYLMTIYHALKTHDDAIMVARPGDHPRADWRINHPAPVRASFRVYEGKKQRMAHINYDTIPVFEILSLGAKPKIIERFDLRSADPASIARYELPAPGDMLSWELAGIRKRLGLTQVQLAKVLDYAIAQNVSDLERETNPKKIPTHIARLMRAYDSGYRPTDWQG